MATEVGICNAALTLVGESAIAEMYPAEETELARICYVHYADVRDAVLREADWNCATLRTTLTALATAPAFGWAYQYPLPTDPLCLRVIGLDEEDYEFGDEWEVEVYRYLDPTTGALVETKVLLSDFATANIRYIGRISPALFDPLLTQAIIYRLAAAIAVARSRSNQLTSSLWQLYQSCIVEAQGTNLAEKSQNRRKKDSTPDIITVRG